MAMYEDEEATLEEEELGPDEEPAEYEKRDGKDGSMAGSIFDKDNPPAWETVLATGIFDGLYELRGHVVNLTETPTGDTTKRAYNRGLIQGNLESLDYMAEALKQAGERDSDYTDKALRTLEEERALILKSLLKP